MFADTFQIFFRQTILESQWWDEGESRDGTRQVLSRLILRPHAPSHKEKGLHGDQLDSSLPLHTHSLSPSQLTEHKQLLFVWDEIHSVDTAR